VPLTTSIGELTDDPGIDIGVRSLTLGVYLTSRSTSSSAARSKTPSAAAS
jgi:hypothetical protein